MTKHLIDMKDSPESLEELRVRESILAKRVIDYEEMHENALKEWMEVKVKLALKREIRARTTPKGR